MAYIEPAQMKIIVIDIELISLRARKDKCKAYGSSDPHSFWNQESRLLEAQIKALEKERKVTKTLF